MTTTDRWEGLWQKIREAAYTVSTVVLGLAVVVASGWLGWTVISEPGSGHGLAVFGWIAVLAAGFWCQHVETALIEIRARLDVLEGRSERPYV